MTEVSKFWQDVILAYKQVATDHSRTIRIYSEAENLTAFVEYVARYDTVEVSIMQGKVGDDDAADGSA